MIYILPYQAHLAIKAIETAKEGYECIVRKVKKQRSLNQNSYYWGVVIKIMAQELGYTDNEMHQVLGEFYLSYDKKVFKGSKPEFGDIRQTFIKSTTELSTIEFENYLENCRRLASENGIFIPLPNECTDDLLHQLEMSKNY